jgi:ribA/ribD-fused uncharacterized protein
MSQHVNIENEESTVPWYAVHEDGKIFGFFGSFSFLSNFYTVPSGIWMDELCYPSVEAAYQAAKWPVNQRAQFVEITAGKAKKLGRLAPGFNQKKWDKNKVSLMASLCRQKFTNSPKLREMLLMTEDCQLEERNSWQDKFWGTDEQGIGENHLGKILMVIRSDLVKPMEIF